MKFKEIVWFLFLLLCSCSQKRDDPFYYTSEEEFIQNNKGLSDTARIGKLIFFDKSLSEPAGKNCASCHSPTHAFSDPGHAIFSTGILGLLGRRNAPALSYNVLAPYKHDVMLRGKWETIGGFFWDGQSEVLINQSIIPMLGSQEMNNQNVATIAKKIMKAPYYSGIEKIFGRSTEADSQNVVLYALLCLEQFQTSYQLSPFTSKYDFYLEGKAKLSPQEQRGLILFTDSTKGKCNICHLDTKDENTGKVMFTDFSYDNIGLQKSPLQKGMPLDSGLGKFEAWNPIEIGRFKTPSLRNIANTAPYMHNGIFNTLEEVMEFYNERDINPKFNHPEVPETVNKEDLGNLELTKQEITDIIVFLKTLSDGYKP